MMADGKYALIGAILSALVATAGVLAGLTRPVTIPEVTFIGLKGE